MGGAGFVHQNIPPILPENPNLPLRRIRGRRLKPDDSFVRLGVTEFLAGQAFKGFWIVTQGVDFSLELFGSGILLFQLAFQKENPRAHPFVLLDERQIAHPDEQQDGQND
jgi:hypothetical protein